MNFEEFKAWAHDRLAAIKLPKLANEKSGNSNNTSSLEGSDSFEKVS